ncbi:hypothetical protein D3C83_154350 [compost metagenome]
MLNGIRTCADAPSQARSPGISPESDFRSQPNTTVLRPAPKAPIAMASIAVRNPRVPPQSQVSETPVTPKANMKYVALRSDSSL